MMGANTFAGFKKKKRLNKPLTIEKQRKKYPLQDFQKQR